VPRNVSGRLISDGRSADLAVLDCSPTAGSHFLGGEETAIEGTLAGVMRTMDVQVTVSG
jgi:hypothetical protein